MVNQFYNMSYLQQTSTLNNRQINSMIKKEIKILREFANSINLESLYRFLVYNFFICYAMMMDMSVPLTD